MIVYLTVADVETVQDHGTVWTITGTTESGERVTFGGDWRPMRDLVAALEVSDDQQLAVEVESWQIRGEL